MSQGALEEHNIYCGPASSTMAGYQQKAIQAVVQSRKLDVSAGRQDIQESQRNRLLASEEMDLLATAGVSRQREQASFSLSLTQAASRRPDPD